MSGSKRCIVLFGLGATLALSGCDCDSSFYCRDRWDGGQSCAHFEGGGAGGAIFIAGFVAVVVVVDAIAHACEHISWGHCGR